MRFATTAFRVRRTVALAAATLVMTAASVAVSLGVPAAVHAEGGLEITSTTSYQVRPAQGVVEVLVSAAYKNVLSSDGSAKNIYFSGSYLPLPVGAINPTLTSGGAPLNFTRKPGQGKGVELMEFEFPSNLNYGQQTSIELRYTLPSGAPRDDKNLSRINPAYVGFEASAIGDPGRTVLEIELPLEFELDKTSSLNGAPVVDGEGARTYRLGGDGLNGTGNADGLQWAWVSATNVATLASSTVDASGAQVQILAWPNDPQFTKYAETMVRDAVPYLEKKLGSKWPGQETRIRESGTPFIYRQPGWFDLGSDIELGENRDRRVAIHQLSHAWFKAPTFTDRWMTEGLAQYVAAAGVSDLYGKKPQPPKPRFKPPLRSWTDKTRGDLAADAAGYDESWYTVDAIFEAVGDAQLPRLLRAATKNQDRKKPLLDHQVLLNVTEPATGENVTTSTEVSTILVEHVVGKKSTEQIKVRNSTREARGALVGAASKWGVPKAVDQSINNWNFKRADQLIGWATDSLKARNALTDKARKANLEVGTESLQETYQKAGNEEQFAQVGTQAKALSDALDNVAEARDAIQGAGGAWYSVGSWFSDSPADHLEAAKQALADGNSTKADLESEQALSTIEATPGRGRLRVGVVVAVVTMVTLVLFVVLRRRSKRRADEDAAAREEPPPPPDPTHIGSLMGAGVGARTPASADTMPEDSPSPASSPLGDGFGRFRPVVQPEPPETSVVRPEPPEIRPEPPEIRPDPPDPRPDPPPPVSGDSAPGGPFTHTDSDGQHDRLDPRPDPPAPRPDPPKIQLVPPELLDSPDGSYPTSPPPAVSDEVASEADGDN